MSADGERNSYRMSPRLNSLKKFKPSVYRSVRILEVVNIRKVAALLFEIEPVTDEELVVDGAAHVFHRDIDYAFGGFVEKSDDFDRGGAGGFQALKEKLQGAAAVDDFFDDQDMLAADIAADVFENRDRTARGSGLAVTGEANELDFGVDLDVTDQIRHENDRALEDTYQYQWLAFVVGVDSIRKGLNGGVDLVAIQVFGKVFIVHHLLFR